MDPFPENLGSNSDDQVERFQLDIKVIETRYQGRRTAIMMADYSWTLTRDIPVAVHLTGSKDRKFMLWILRKNYVTLILHRINFINVYYSI